MRLTELTKRVSLQQLYRVGHYSDEEIKEMRKDGWWIVWHEGKRKPRKITQRKKNGIPIERVV